MAKLFDRINYIALGDRARDARHWREAAEYYRKALAVLPHNAPIWVQYGHALKESGRLAEAEAAYRQALIHAPLVGDTYLQLGHALKVQGKADQMQEAYLQAFIHDPALPDLMHELSRLGWSEAELMELRYQLAPEGAALPDPVAQRASKTARYVRPVADDGARLKLSVDRPVRLGDRVAQPVRGGLQIEGWALAQDGVAEISATIDGMPVGNAKCGLRRPDILEAYPDWPESLMSGFALMVTAKHLVPGEHRLEVSLLSAGGRIVSTAFDFVVDHGDTFALRRKMPRTEIDMLETQLQRHGQRPHIGLLLDVAGPAQVKALGATLESLRLQAYRDWTLTILCRPQHETRLNALLADIPALAEQVTVVTDAAEDTALAALSAHAALVGLLAAGDMLACDALLQLAVAKAVHSAADFLYGDERRISPATGRMAPFFKPQWSPDLLLSTNYIGRFWCAAPRLLVGMTLDDWRTCGEYDLVLRATEAAGRIHHLPVILCERGQAAIDDPGQEKVALYRAMARRGIEGTVEDGPLEGYFRLARAVASEALVSVIIPVGGKPGLLEKSLTGLLENTAHRNLDIVLVRNCGTQTDALPYLESLTDPRVRVVADGGMPFNFSRVCNLGAAAAKGEYLLFLNDDIEVVAPDWIDRLLQHAQRPDVGIVGARLLYPDGQIQHGGMFWVDGQDGARHAFRHLGADEPGYFGLAQTTRNVLAVTGACIMLRRSWFEEIGRFEERHVIVNNDVDLCLRCWRHGGAVVYEPGAVLVHHELATRGDLPDSYDSAAFQAEWGNLIHKGDPYYNSNLARDADDYAPDLEACRRLYAAGPLFLPGDIQRILLVKLDHLGDFITALPAIRKLKAQFPNAEFHLLAPPGTALLAETFLDGLESVIPFEFFHARSGEGVRSVSDEEKQQLQESLAPYLFDLAIDLRMHMDTREILPLTGARWLAGYDQAFRFPWLDIALEWEGDIRLMPKRAHVSDNLVRLADAVIVATGPAAAVLSADVTGESYSLSGRPLVCIHPGVGTLSRQWPARHYAALINLLVNNHDVEVVLIGSPDEAPIVAEVLEKVVRHDAVRSLAGAVPLTELASLLASAMLFVGNNSGPKHIAAGLGVPTIGIHSGAVDAVEWGPIGPNALALQRDMVCGPCYISLAEQCPRGLACLTELSPAVVYTACRDLLTATASEATAH